MENELLVTNLQNFGLSQYEAKTYIALLHIGTSNAYSISKSSEIPRSRIYDILNNLAARGIVMVEETNDGVKNYTALPANVFLEEAYEKWSKIYTHVNQELKAIEAKNKQDIYVSTVKGETNILAFCRKLLQKAEKKVVISIWNPMYLELLADLQNCIERGCSVSGITFEVECPLRTLDKHRLNKINNLPTKKKWFILSIDSKELLYGHAAEHNSNSFFTTDPVHIYLLEDYIFHDVLVNRIIEKENKEEMAVQMLSDILSEVKSEF
ncbi:Sugar-specific transcriptional regulator TrmB [Sporomusa ovata DSM 2662]|uniref:Transcriptional regulator, TrmB family n=1 Tax=Sporomusa ovata TaxID=2378 RepID=A0A0U1L0F3_9FIRM|nr:TrmB family transcriptional regulator [Sporomusa ovata]EQB27299.1 transcriptional regulator, TrmB [Sporomusa ovata DSM 2662]CQR73141.1 Transcriptional regulator, TrmB family [Sporomusa ovata]